MCLSTVTKRFDKNKRVVKGFKVIDLDIYRDGVAMQQPTLVSFPRGTSLKIGVWMQAKKSPTKLGRNDYQYDNGFHIFKTRNAAKNYGLKIMGIRGVVEVKGRDLRAIGTQRVRVVVFVCKELFITDKDIKQSKKAS